MIYKYNIKKLNNFTHCKDSYNTKWTSINQCLNMFNFKTNKLVKDRKK